jgi:putative flippase GtrA
VHIKDKNMVKLGKLQLSSLLATSIDFLITISFIGILEMWYLAATMLGTLCGGIVQFYLNRNWVFSAQKGNIRYQAVRYGAIWAGSLLLNGGGVYLLTHFLSFNYLAGKIVISLIMGCTYNYLLQSHFVFVKS